MRLWVLLILERWFARYEPDFALAVKPLVDRAHGEFLRLGRPGDPHPDRGARLPGPRSSRHAGRAGARRRSPRPASGSACRSSASTSGASGSPNFLALRRWLARHRARNRRPQHAQLDRQLALGARLRDAARRAADRAHAPRVDHDPQSPDDALALRARDRAYRHDRRGAASASSRATTAFRSTA